MSGKEKTAVYYRKKSQLISNEEQKKMIRNLAVQIGGDRPLDRQKQLVRKSALLRGDVTQLDYDAKYYEENP